MYLNLHLQHHLLRLGLCFAIAVTMLSSGVVSGDESWFHRGTFEGRKTLFQWSYGTSFDGGPPGYDEPLVTDRPDFTEASTTVGRGVVQLETGYTYFYDSEDGGTTKLHSLPESLFRIGMFAQWFELRIAPNYVEETTRGPLPTDFASGADDLYLGIKLGLTPQEGILPEMALIPQMFVPTGSSEITADEVLPGVNWIYAWDITERLSTAGSTQANRSLDDVTGDAFWLVAQSWVFGYSITERVGSYIEYFGLYPHSADTVKPTHFINGGFTLLVTNNLQFDWRVGVGLNKAAADYFTGTGFSVRF